MPILLRVAPLDDVMRIVVAHGQRMPMYGGRLSRCGPPPQDRVQVESCTHSLHVGTILAQGSVVFLITREAGTSHPAMITSTQLGMPHLADMHWSKKLMWWLIGRSLDVVRIGTVFGFFCVLGASPFCLFEYGRCVCRPPPLRLHAHKTLMANSTPLRMA